MAGFFSRLFKRSTSPTHGAESGMMARFKAHMVGDAPSNAMAPEDQNSLDRVFGMKGAVEPPLPFSQLQTLLFTSNALRQNIDAMIVNIDGTGWRLKPTVDVFGDNAWEVVQEFQSRRGIELSKEEATALAVEWKALAEQERDRITHWLDYLNPEITFEELRKRMRMDKEVLGNGAWEFVRDEAGRLAQVYHIPFVNLRLLPLDDHAIEVEWPQKKDPITLHLDEITRRFRRYVQIQDNAAIYFKELGDPRITSSKTGRRYKTAEDLEAKETNVRQATEILHFPLYAPNETYGQPRWSGATPEVIGSRMAAEVNVMYFENKSVPPLIMLVSGGRVSSDSIGRIRDHVQNHIKGQENYHNILIVEAEAEGDAKNAGRAQIQIKSLTEAQHQDALFQKYDQRNIDKIGATFRIPGMLRGDIKELNRATATVAKALAEEQVFQPERDSFDAEMNRKIFPRLGIRFWEFKSNASNTRDPQTLATMLTQLVQNGIILPIEARAIVPEIIGTELPPCDEDFLKAPLRLVLARERTNAIREREQGKPLEEQTEQKSSTGLADLLLEGGRTGAENGGGLGSMDEGRLKALLAVAEDASVLRTLMDRIERDRDVAGITEDDLARLIKRDGSQDSEEIVGAGAESSA